MQTFEKRKEKGLYQCFKNATEIGRFSH